jgi:hypothetical protein
MSFKLVLVLEILGHAINLHPWTKFSLSPKSYNSMNFVDYDIIKVHIFSKVDFQVLESMYSQIVQAIDVIFNWKHTQSIDSRYQTILVGLFIVFLSIAIFSILGLHHKCSLWYKSIVTTNNINQCELKIYHVSYLSTCKL